jgi:hypothetical protein
MRNVVFRSTSIPLPGFSLGGNCKGYRYVCSACGELWGGLEVAPQGRYIISCWPCERHGDTWTRGGSFLHRLAWGDYSNAKDLTQVLDNIGPELLLHEVKMRIIQVLGEKYD